MATTKETERSAGAPRGSSSPVRGVTVDLQGVSRSFGEVHAVADVSATIRPGEFVAIVGPSGCGKSTLLSIVSGLDHPTSGAVFIDGTELTGPYHDVGIAFQRDTLLDWASVLDNVLFYPRMRGTRTDAHVAEAKQLLGLAGLAGFERSYPSQLSGGMRQRVAVCRALLHRPSMLVMDEPFAAVDALTRERLNAELDRLLSNWRATTVFVTHSIAEALYLADRVWVMSPRPGRIVHEVVLDESHPRQLSFRDSQQVVAQGRVIREIFEKEGVL